MACAFLLLCNCQTTGKDVLFILLPLRSILRFLIVINWQRYSLILTYRISGGVFGQQIQCWGKQEDWCQKGGRKDVSLSKWKLQEFRLYAVFMDWSCIVFLRPEMYFLTATIEWKDYTKQITASENYWLHWKYSEKYRGRIPEITVNRKGINLFIFFIYTSISLNNIKK